VVRGATGQRNTALSPQGRKLAGVIALILSAVMLYGASRVLPLREVLSAFLHWVESLDAWGPVALAIAYVVATILLVPGSILTLGAGALFGVVTGTITVSIGSTIGATAAFLIGRHFARETVAQRISHNKVFVAIDRAVAHDGWKVVGLVRLSPVMPYNVVNYAFGLTHVRLSEYVVATWIGMLPATVLYVYIGSLARDVASVFSGSRARTPGEWFLLAIGLLATVVLTVYLSRKAKQILDQNAVEESAEP